MDNLEKLDKVIELLFPGKYRSVGYEFSTDHEGKRHPIYRCYVEGFPYGHGTTVGIALFEMMKDGEGPK